MKNDGSGTCGHETPVQGCDVGPFTLLAPPPLLSCKGVMTVLMEGRFWLWPESSWPSLEIREFDGKEPLAPPPGREPDISPPLGGLLRGLTALSWPAWALAGTTLEVKMLDREKCCGGEMTRHDGTRVRSQRM